MSVSVIDVMWCSDLLCIVLCYRFRMHLIGGHAWPDDKQDEVTRYTMVLEYEVCSVCTVIP